MKIKNYSKIQGKVKVGGISLSAAEHALEAMQEKAERGGYEMLFADDASFVRESFNELKSFIKDCYGK